MLFEKKPDKQGRTGNVRAINKFQKMSENVGKRIGNISHQ